MDQADFPFALMCALMCALTGIQSVGDGVETLLAASQVDDACHNVAHSALGCFVCYLESRQNDARHSVNINIERGIISLTSGIRRMV